MKGLMKEDTLDLLGLDRVEILGDFIEGSKLKVITYKGNTVKTFLRKVYFNRRDGLYFVLNEMKVFEYDFDLD